MTDEPKVPRFEITISDEDVARVVKASVREAVEHVKAANPAPVDALAPSRLEEAYVAQGKTYAMTTDALSEPAKKAHEQLYKGYAEALSRVSVEVDAADKRGAASARSPYRSAKKDEAYNLNATYLHELFFANCFDPNSELFQDQLAFMRLARDWGTFDAWMEDFMACAMSARNGWVVCGYSLFLKRFTNVCVDSHDQGVIVGLVPAIVIDMFEHAYERDYGNDKRTYLTAMMRELNWEVIEDRVERVEGIQKVMG